LNIGAEPVTRPAGECCNVSAFLIYNQPGWRYIRRHANTLKEMCITTISFMGEKYGNCINSGKSKTTAKEKGISSATTTVSPNKPDLPLK